METEMTTLDLLRATAKDSMEEAHLYDWYSNLLGDRRLHLRRGEEGWRLALDGHHMSYGETPAAAVRWAYVMSHKSAYE